ncbi:MAG TPA: hypothetical protein VFI37_11575 [Gaiellaceae bacterium]|jgi:hypothetical protein|nr:hypothetical protein [Gaiellaceae bacterium]
MRLRIDPSFAESLRRHLCLAGFPATQVDPGQIDVLFPGSPGIFPAAVELDLWEAREPGGAATLQIER